MHKQLMKGNEAIVRSAILAGCRGFYGYPITPAREITEAEVGAGDIVLYRVGRAYAHAAIVVDWPRAVIHAHKLSGKVVEMPAFDADMQGRKVRFFSIVT